MKNWLEGESDDPVELEHMTYNFTKAYVYYSGINNFATDNWGNPTEEYGGASCKTWGVASSLTPTMPYSGDCLVGRTLQGMSKDMSGEPMYDTYNNYWGSTTYADDFVSAALLGTTDPGSGVDFGALTDAQRVELAMKGAAYQTMWMYTLHEYESAIVKCEAGSLDDDSGAPHAWDEGWAYYAGSLQTEGESDGYLTYTLAQMGCENFGTCDATSGTAVANEMHLAHAISGLAHIRAGECAEANDDLTEIKKWMTAPLIQGALRSAYKCDPAALNEGPEACAAGYAFAAAVLPQIDRCDANAAMTVETNMIFGANVPDGFAAVKSAIESTYSCLGITCENVGGLHYSGMEACSNCVQCSRRSRMRKLLFGHFPSNCC